jgi:hypothetical protein
MVSTYSLTTDGRKTAVLRTAEVGMGAALGRALM